MYNLGSDCGDIGRFYLCEVSLPTFVFPNGALSVCPGLCIYVHIYIHSHGAYVFIGIICV